MDVKVFIGKRIKALRNRLHLTQDELSERVNISPKYLSNIERGKENPTLNTLLRLAKSLKVEIWELFLIEQESSDIKSLQKRIEHLLQEADSERLQLIVNFLRSVLH